MPLFYIHNPILRVRTLLLGGSALCAKTPSSVPGRPKIRSLGQTFTDRSPQREDEDNVEYVV